MKFYVGYFYPWCRGKRFYLCAIFDSEYEANLASVRFGYQNPFPVAVYNYLPEDHTIICR